MQKDQADALVRLQDSLDQLEKIRECPPPEASDFYTHDNVWEPASPEHVMEGHAPWESQETTERVENVVEEEVVGDNATSDLTTFDVFENVNNVELVMSESIPSPDNLVDEDVEEEAVSGSTDPSPTIPENFEKFEHFESKERVMGDLIPPPDKTSRSLLVPIHLLDEDQDDDDDEVVFENNKHDVFATHHPLMNGKLDTKTASCRRHALCGKMRRKTITGSGTGVLKVKPVILKRHRGKDRAWRFKATSKHLRELIRKRQPGNDTRTDKPFDPGKLEYGINEWMVVTGNQRSKMAYDPP
ncbi:hypothetical protein L2E82_49133 [Cichorium intybus]|uniref:Uncharacterized protein n=1 Tax=Cichorium intybus TaxID=13427 RepID=A0ACB8YZL6_CICIN|nr:hypothetical protein L2E82_49133 [Cichorium intybus]